MIAWKKVDLPTLAKPTIPDFKLLPGLPSKIGFSATPFFFGGMINVECVVVKIFRVCDDMNRG